MSTVDIPEEEAMDVAAWRTFSESLSQADSHLDYVAALADAITAVAPLIVATELRRLRQELKAKLEDDLGDDQATGVRISMQMLNIRAKELDPPGGAS